ncbi:MULTISPECIES: agmatine deiminase family protein [Acidithiobacillus]|jgi:agmatine deiminase|uniref:Agmatine deiminase n=3 Tax=Acidithiobacillus caldus TaxID=33059 RepID=F9ZLX2_ACICS|nr:MULTISPECIES: agmatine deiminase family protein [Acidithiobacillus]AEK57455.1 Agmatine deiminase [Acidithiobacillus caldus SM-1]AIA54664.1 Agmatine deiminase [Acidithiobacillus caldus ATCC 51756]AUW32169.1 agmatine deiminase family protein [Acidithiobacillus caldus]MBU2729281.1 agmatine deiminase family protein [Acidithiobacillus caldus]MBU2737165.1 agmatine deiminase family protein [Acidithiobacillus caldus ATCC 51756]
MTFTLPAEWAPQSAVQLTWPHRDTDWAERLPLVLPVFTQIALAISQHEDVLLVCHDTESLAEARARVLDAGASPDRCHFVVAPSNDSWARDHGPLTLRAPDGRRRLLDFGFNAWGLKFAADRDNLLTRRLHQAGAYGDLPLRTLGMILEGGSIDSDGAGTLLTTSACLLSPNRNPQWSREEISARLCEYLGAERVLWLESGYLEGDDTDAHIDTLARFCSTDTIAYQSCDDPDDNHFAPLQQMAAELAGFPRADGGAYHLVPLPWPRARYDEAGTRLPLSYANFLIINGAVLLPTYDDAADAVAMERLAEVFPQREVVPILCLELARQHGSLHCVTMQIPS